MTLIAIICAFLRKAARGKGRPREGWEEDEVDKDDDDGALSAKV